MQRRGCLVPCLVARLIMCLAAPPQQAPNILLIVADDLGYNDVGYHNSEIETPFIDAMARDGVRLESYYTHYLCSPTRASLLTGRYPIRYGWQHENAPVALTPVAVPLEEVFLPQKLQEAAGYKTHMVGKWHLGYYAAEYLPTSRGFDSHLGYYEGYMDYYAHTSTLGRLDLHNGTSCLPQLSGTYSLPVFLHEAQRLLRQHDDSQGHPLFLYLPFQSVHAPLEVPQRYTDRYAWIQAQDRRAYAGMVTYLDEAVGSVLATARAKGDAFWNNTIVFFISDNGGQPRNGGNNYPLRGCKGTLFEGGMRAVAVVHSPLIAKPGRVEHGLMHVTDLHATLLALATAHNSSAPQAKPPTDPRPLDGLNQWPTISDGAPSPRSEILHNFDPLYGGQRINSSAIRRGPWKLLRGPYADCHPAEDPLQCGWDKPPKLSVQPAVSSMPDKDVGDDLIEVARRLSEQAPIESLPHRMAPSPSGEPVALYNIETDPLERVNLASRHPDVVAELMDRLDEYFKESVPPLVAPSEKDAWLAAVHKAGCTAPWH